MKKYTYGELYWGHLRNYLPQGVIPNVFLDEDEVDIVQHIMHLTYYPSMLRTNYNAYLPFEIDGVTIYVSYRGA